MSFIQLHVVKYYTTKYLQHDITISFVVWYYSSDSGYGKEICRVD